MDRAAIEVRRDQLAKQRDGLIAADQEQHERLVGQINAIQGAMQDCDYWLGQLGESEAAQ